jgi:hypothetical protein
MDMDRPPPQPEQGQGNMDRTSEYVQAQYWDYPAQGFDRNDIRRAFYDVESSGLPGGYGVPLYTSEVNLSDEEI